MLTSSLGDVRTFLHHLGCHFRSHSKTLHIDELPQYFSTNYSPNYQAWHGHLPALYAYYYELDDEHSARVPKKYQVKERFRKYQVQQLQEPFRGLANPDGTPLDSYDFPSWFGVPVVHQSYKDFLVRANSHSFTEDEFADAVQELVVPLQVSRVPKLDNPWRMINGKAVRP